MIKIVYAYNVKLKNKETGKVSDKTHRFMAPNMKFIRDMWDNNYYEIHSIKKASPYGYKVNTVDNPFKK